MYAEMSEATIGKPTLGIDHGGRRVGIAVSVGLAPRPIDVLSHRDTDALIERILDIAADEQVKRIVIGLPLHADGSEGEQAKEVRAFAEQLADETTLPVFLWDERHTSQRAEELLIAAGTGQRARRDKLDAVAAAVLLQEFFAQNGVGAERVEPT